jgi:hypothetical protein
VRSPSRRPARRAKVSEQSVGNWKRQFLEAGKSGLVAGKSGPSTREQQLEAEVTELTCGVPEPQAVASDQRFRSCVHQGGV